MDKIVAFVGIIKLCDRAGSITLPENTAAVLVIAVSFIVTGGNTAVYHIIKYNVLRRNGGHIHRSFGRFGRVVEYAMIGEQKRGEYDD